MEQYLEHQIDSICLLAKFRSVGHIIFIGPIFNILMDFERSRPKSTPLSHDSIFQVHLRQLDEDVEYQVLARGPKEKESSDLSILQEYFNLHEPLAKMTKQWAESDDRFKLISPFFPGKLLSNSGHQTQILIFVVLMKLNVQPCCN